MQRNFGMKALVVLCLLERGFAFVPPSHPVRLQNAEKIRLSFYGSSITASTDNVTVPPFFEESNEEDYDEDSLPKEMMRLPRHSHEVSFKKTQQKTCDAQKQTDSTTHFYKGRERNSGKDGEYSTGSPQAFQGG